MNCQSTKSGRSMGVTSGFSCRSAFSFNLFDWLFTLTLLLLGPCWRKKKKGSSLSWAIWHWWNKQGLGSQLFLLLVVFVWKRAAAAISTRKPPPPLLVPLFFKKLFFFFFLCVCVTRVRKIFLENESRSVLLNRIINGWSEIFFFFLNFKGGCVSRHFRSGSSNEIGYERGVVVIPHYKKKRKKFFKTKVTSPSHLHSSRSSIFFYSLLGKDVKKDFLTPKKLWGG